PQATLLPRPCAGDEDSDDHGLASRLTTRPCHVRRCDWRCRPPADRGRHALLKHHQRATHETLPKEARPEPHLALGFRALLGGDKRVRTAAKKTRSLPTVKQTADNTRHALAVALVFGFAASKQLPRQFNGHGEHDRRLIRPGMPIPLI